MKFLVHFSLVLSVLCEIAHPQRTSAVNVPRHRDGTAVKELVRHSFTQQMDYRTFASRWTTLGTALPLQSHIMLSPAVADRWGCLWHKYPLLTNDFEVDFRVITSGPDLAPHNQGFAFWYVYENATLSIPSDITTQAVTNRLEKEKLSLFGYRNNFNGLGVFFSNKRVNKETKNSELKPSISILQNDGGQYISPTLDIPTVAGSYWGYRNNKLRIKIRARPDRITVDAIAEGIPNAKWLNIAELIVTDPKQRLRPGGFLGFTGAVLLSSQSDQNNVNQADTVVIEDLHVYNMDPTQKGEDVPDVQAYQKKKSKMDKIDEQIEKEWGEKSSEIRRKSDGTLETSGDVLGDGNEAKQIKIEGKAISDLAHMVVKMITSLNPIRKSFTKAISTLNLRTDMLEESILSLKEDINETAGRNLDEELNKIKEEISHLVSHANEDYESKRAHYDKLHSVVDSVSGFHEKTKKLSDTLGEVQARSREMRTTVRAKGTSIGLITVVAVFMIAGIGFAMYSRFKCWEKRHIL